MRKYELMVIMKKDFQHDDEKTRKELIERLLTQQPVENLTVSDFGKRELAYEIKKETEGCYILAEFQSKAVVVSKIEEQTRLMDNVLRYLLTNVAEVK